MIEWLGALPGIGKIIRLLFPKKEKEQKISARNAKICAQNQDSHGNCSLVDSPYTHIDQSSHLAVYIMSGLGITPDDKMIEKNLGSFTESFQETIPPGVRQKCSTPENYRLLHQAASFAATCADRDIQKTLLLILREKLSNDQSTTKENLQVLALEKIKFMTSDQLNLLTLIYLLRDCTVTGAKTKEELIASLKMNFNAWKIFLKPFKMEDFLILETHGCINLSRGLVVGPLPDFLKHQVKKYNNLLSEADWKQSILSTEFEEFWKKFNIGQSPIHILGQTIAQSFFQACTGQKINSSPPLKSESQTDVHSPA